MRIKSFPLIFLLLFLARVPLTLADNALPEPVADISGSVQSLYASAQKLSLGNSLLAVHLNEVNMKITAMQLRSKQLAMENDRLSQEAMKLTENDPAKARKIASMEKESFDIDAAIEELKMKIKADADAMTLAPVQEARYDQRLTELGLNKAAPVPVVESNTTEKLRLLKMIQESKKRQDALYTKIIAGQVSVPVVRVESSAQKNALLASIRKVEEEVDQLNKMLAAPARNDADNSQLKQLQAQVATLQRNYDELEVLETRLQQKSQQMQKNVEQRGEYSRLKENLLQINKGNAALKMQIRDLRVQMVELDKRKSFLEAMIRN